MRGYLCSFLLLTGCAGHEVQCDKHLQRINAASSVMPAGPAGRAAGTSPLAGSGH